MTAGIKQFYIYGNLFLLPLIALLSSCQNTDATHKKNVKVVPVNFDLKIDGAEAKEEVACLFRFRKGGPSRAFIRLKEPETVQLDGEELNVDSARITGPYYEAIKTRDDFVGSHEVVFTDTNGVAYKEHFDYKPFSLQTELPEKIKRRLFAIKLKDAEDENQSFRLVMIDTSFTSNGVNQLVKLQNGSLNITPEMWAQLKNGPIFLEIISENEHFMHTDAFNGRISINYSLKRAFELVD